MREVMYNQNSILIAAILFASLVLAIELGYRIGCKARASASEASRSHVNAIQASLLGILALLLGFTFSLSLQRYDSRSEAVVDEANAIGTAYLRAQLLPASVRGEAQMLLRDYLDVRIREGTVPLSNQAERQALLLAAGRHQDALWRYALQATQENPNPATSGLFAQALNELIDSYGRRNAALNRHVPEVVLFLLYGTFVMTWGIVGYASGVAGHRPSLTAYIMLVLIVLLVFVIIDLDRPRRGLIGIDQTSLTDLQAVIEAAQDGDGRSSVPKDGAGPGALQPVTLARRPISPDQNTRTAVPRSAANRACTCSTVSGLPGHACGGTCERRSRMRANWPTYSLSSRTLTLSAVSPRS